MSHVPGRTGIGGPQLIRLLARLTGTDAPAPGQALSAQLSEWLAWTDAVALSAALQGSAPMPAAPSRVADRDADAEAECERVRAMLTRAIVQQGDSRRRKPGRPPVAADPAATPVDYASFRQRYLSLQQTMESAIESLRQRLRGMLASHRPAMAGLVRVDAVMERVLAGREQLLLAGVPTLLEAHFERMRQEAGDVPGPWLRVFQEQMQGVLLAELELRFQPVEALLAALRDA